MVKRKTSANKSRKRKGRRQRPLTKTKTKPRQSNKSSRPKRYFSKRGRPPSLDRVRRTIAEVDGTTVKPISKPSNTEIKSLRNENKKKLVEKPQEGLFENYVERLRRHAILGE